MFPQSAKAWLPVAFLGCVFIFPANATETFLVAPSAQGLAPLSELRLEGRYDRPRMALFEMDGETVVADWTDAAQFETLDPSVVRVETNGRLIPVGAGTTVVRASYEDSRRSVDVTVQAFDREPEVGFVDRIVPIFTKAGCNGGGCHGKSGGQNGFRLSLLGFEPLEDYEWLVKESRGRRISPTAPERSLLLQKATGEIPHGGGARLSSSSEDYETMVRWIRQGLPFGDPEAATLSGIEVFPDSMVAEKNALQRLIVVAHYSDGRREDVTGSALFEANRPELAEVDEDGLVQFGSRPGDVAVMVRFQGKVGVFRAMIPLGAPLLGFPEPANYIDSHVFAKLRQAGIPVSDLSSDETFLRRVTLDIAGRLPTPEESNAFFRDPSPEKRESTVDRLLDSRDYAEHFGNLWSALLRNQRDPRRSEVFKPGTYAFHGWIVDQLNQNLPYDEFARRILTASGDVRDNPPVAWYRQVNETKEIMEDTAQLFLGTRLQCAQCHHHPFERWSQKDYYQFTAFFSRIGRQNHGRPSEARVYHRVGRPSARNPKDGAAVRPAGLGSAVLTSISPLEDPRDHLVDWMVDPENPLFARALVNRYWKRLMGRGLVEPEDDFRATNPPTNPELLEAMAQRFVDSGFDLKRLIRDICVSTVYQLDSVPNDWNQIDQQYFSRYYPRRLLAESTLDAIDTLTGVPTAFGGVPSGTRALALPDNGFNRDSYFLTVFGRPDAASACECERTEDPSLAQSLHLLNSSAIQEKLVHESGVAARLAGDTSRTHEERIAELYRIAFARAPDIDESAFARDYIERRENTGATDGERKDRVKQAYEDLVWALLNTKEFLFNH